MRLALFVLALCIVALAATTNREGKRQINHYLPYYGPNNEIEPRQIRPTKTTTLTQISTVTYTLTCVKSTTACPSSSNTTSTTTASTNTTSITPTPTSATTNSTASSTVGRRRREIDNIDLEAEDWVNEQLSIVPSNVQG